MTKSLAAAIFAALLCVPELYWLCPIGLASLGGFALPGSHSLRSPAAAHPIQSAKPAEYDVKAAFLYNFGKFVRWPASRNRNEFRICVLGRDPFGATLDSIIAGETVDGRTVAARRIAESADSAGCQIVFISLSEEKRLKEILDVVDKAGALTVSEIPRFTQRGGMIGFVLADGRVRFEVNLAPADSAGLMFSSELLRVASSVKRNPGA